MLLPRQKGAVADWTFEGGAVDSLTWPTLEESLAVTAKVTAILDSYRLQSTDTLVLSQWMTAGPQDVAHSKRVERPNALIEIGDGATFAGAIEQCRAFVESEFLYPLRIEASGPGVLFTESGEAIVYDLVRVQATTLDKFSITVSTQSDAWLPFSLSGHPQQTIAAANAPRLARTLEHIQREIRFELERGVTSVYAVINGFGLDNVRYADGSLADVL